MAILQQIFPVLKDVNGVSIKCQCGCGRVARHIHHIKPRCQGGTDHPNNLLMLCQKCHTAHHSQQGDFKKWGSISGKMQKDHLTFLFTLKQFRTSPQKRLEYVLDKMPDKLEVLVSLELCYNTSYETEVPALH